MLYDSSGLPLSSPSLTGSGQLRRQIHVVRWHITRHYPRCFHSNCLSARFPKPHIRSSTLGLESHPRWRSWRPRCLTQKTTSSALKGREARHVAGCWSPVDSAPWGPLTPSPEGRRRARVRSIPLWDVRRTLSDASRKRSQDPFPQWRHQIWHHPIAGHVCLASQSLEPTFVSVLIFHALWDFVQRNSYIFEMLFPQVQSRFVSSQNVILPSRIMKLSFSVLGCFHGPQGFCLLSLLRLLYTHSLTHYLVRVIHFFPIFPFDAFVQRLTDIPVSINQEDPIFPVQCCWRLCTPSRSSLLQPLMSTHQDSPWLSHRSPLPPVPRRSAPTSRTRSLSTLMKSRRPPWDLFRSSYRGSSQCSVRDRLHLLADSPAISAHWSSLRTGHEAPHALWIPLPAQNFHPFERPTACLVASSRTFLHKLRTTTLWSFPQRPTKRSLSRGKLLQFGHR